MKDPDSIPSYEWCSTDPLSCGVPWPPSPDPIPELLIESVERPFPLVDPARAAGAGEALEPISHPRIRRLAAYWHSGWPYATPIAALRGEAVARLASAAAALPAGFGLAVWDAWRDPRLQESLHSVAYRDPRLPPGFVNPPSADPATPPPHATGGTVDLTLTWDNRPLALGTKFDEFVDRARSRSLEALGDDDPLALARDLRRLLRSVMITAGFVQLECEWWHFEYGTRLWAAVRNREPIYPAIERPFQLSVPLRLPTSE